MNYILYHKVDWDGVLSAAIAVKALGKENCTLVPINYKDNWVCPPLNDGDKVYVLDFSHDVLSQHPDKCVWIDHHKTAIEKYYTTIAGRRSLAEAACNLVWEWFNDPEETPLVIDLCGLYDIWNISRRVIEWNAGMYACIPLDPDAWQVQALLLGYGLLEQEVKDAGAVLVQSQMLDAKRTRGLADAGIFIRNGLTSPLVNMYAPASEVYVSWHCQPDDTIKVELRNSRINENFENVSSGVDVAAIAKKFGGGGHHGAAGFHLEGRWNNRMILEAICSARLTL